MIAIGDDTTIGDAFIRAVGTYAERPFLAVPAGAHRGYHRNGYEIGFTQAGREVTALIARPRRRGAAAGFIPATRCGRTLTACCIS